MLSSFDIDKYLNRVVPDPRYERWPKAISWIFGYRAPGSTHPRPIHDWNLWLWILVTTFTGMVVVQLPYRFGPEFIDRMVPVVMPSIAATAILIYNAIDTPLAQPRNVIVGTFMSSLIGLCIEKLFMTNTDNRRYLWLSGALSVAVSSVFMKMTNCVHPPAGAAALLPSAVIEVRAIGWYYLPVQLLSTVLVVVVACLFNNIQRRYPVFWWTPASLKKKHQSDIQTIPENEKNGSFEEREVKITRHGIEIPEDLEVSQEYVQFLEEIKQMLVELADN